MAPKKIAQTVLTEGKFYTISAANGKVIEVADYNIDNGAKTLRFLFHCFVSI